jgi:protein involved in polysaccharide export with SLBB domain
MCRALRAFFVVVGVLWLCGCALRGGVDWSKVMREYGGRWPAREADETASSGTETPDTPAAGLPGTVPGSAPESASVPDLPPVAVEDATQRPTVAKSFLTIQPESVIDVSVVEDPALSGRYTVNSIGAIQLGYLGPVILYNMTEREAETKIKRLLESREFRNATVSVKMFRVSYDKIKVVGNVGRPGIIKIGAGDSVSLRNALMRAGGVRSPAGLTRVKIVRGGLLSPLAPSLNGEVYTLAKSDGTPHVPDVEMRNNDIVFVQAMSRKRAGGRGSTSTARPRTVLVLGEVHRQGFYAFAASQPATMMNLIFQMGGLPPYANDKAIRVIRRNEEDIDEEFRVNAREILKEGDPDLDFELAHGDRIIVPARRISLF